MTVEYTEDRKIAFFGEYKFTRDNNTGYYLSTTRIGKSRKRLHVYVWEYYNGNIPRGYQIHHKDGNKGNNDIINLDCLSEHEHLSHHSKLNSQTKKGKEQFYNVQMASKE